MPRFKGKHPLNAKQVVTLVRKYLEPHQPRDFRLDVMEKAERQPDGWWYVYFRPSRPNLRSYEYEGRVVEATMDLAEREGLNVVLLEDSLVHAA